MLSIIEELREADIIVNYSRIVKTNQSIGVTHIEKMPISKFGLSE